MFDFVTGTLNPALQDRHGQPKRDITTIIHILNDLLCAQYKNYAASGASAAKKAASAEAAAAASAAAAAANAAAKVAAAQFAKGQMTATGDGKTCVTL